MIDWIRGVAEAVIGLSVTGVGAAVLVYFVYTLARHRILLFGVVRPHEVNPDTYVYSFFAQNLENVAFPGAFRITLSGTRPAVGNRNLAVQVFAGPKYV